MTPAPLVAFGLISCVVAASAMTAVAQLGELREFDYQGAEALRERGYVLTESSLIEAVFDSDGRIAGEGIIFLGRVAESAEAVAVLMAVLNSGRDGLANIAARALQRLSARDWAHRAAAGRWETAALGRLPGMADQAAQIRLAITLAGVGRGQGWQYLRSGFHRGLGASAEALLLFEGLPDESGQAIEVATELEAIARDSPTPTGRQTAATALQRVQAELKRRQGSPPDGLR